MCVSGDARCYGEDMSETSEDEINELETLWQSTDDENSRRRCALHESGHAVMDWLLLGRQKSIELGSITIRERGDHGYHEGDYLPSTLYSDATAEVKAAILLGGWFGQRCFAEAFPSGQALESALDKSGAEPDCAHDLLRVSQLRPNFDTVADIITNHQAQAAPLVNALADVLLRNNGAMNSVELLRFFSGDGDD